MRKLLHQCETCVLLRRLRVFAFDRPTEQGGFWEATETPVTSYVYRVPALETLLEHKLQQKDQLFSQKKENTMIKIGQEKKTIK